MKKSWEAGICKKMITEDEIRARVAELGKQITADLISIIKDPCCNSEKLHPSLIMLTSSAIKDWCIVGKSFK